MSVLNVIGLGYIGLPTALMFAESGIKVVGSDINTNIIDKLKDKELTFNEYGLEEVFNNAINNGIEFCTKYIKTNRYIVTVPTPFIESNKKIDVTYVISAINSIIEICENNTIIVIESTISPGTIDKFIRPIIDEYNSKFIKNIKIAHAPERIIPGKMISELRGNSRVIGADDKTVGETVSLWYKSFCKGEIVVTDIKTAEMSKVVENTYRDVNIAFANELVRICRKEQIDVYKLIKVANMHPRVNILQPGPGVGGHCISVDPWFLVGDYPDIVNIILSARKVNNSMPLYVIERIKEIMLENKISDISRVGLYGLTYKEDINDIRESPSIQLINELNKVLINGVKSYDPWIETKLFEGQYTDFEKFIDDIDLLVIMVGHEHIKQNKDLIRDKLILDTRNCINFKSNYKL
ncbi:MAG: nucleotide sugar dehydrogenase [Clostridium sp.]